MYVSVQLSDNHRWCGCVTVLLSCDNAPNFKEWCTFMRCMVGSVYSLELSCKLHSIASHALSLSVFVILSF